MFQDFKEFLSELNASEAHYLIIGGYAVGFHAQPRATGDLDILIQSDIENARAVYKAMSKYGAPVKDIRPEDLIAPDSFFCMGNPPLRIDILTSISGVSFTECWDKKVMMQIDSHLTVPVISKENLMTNKISAGRPQDIADVAAIRAAMDGKK